MSKKQIQDGALTPPQPSVRLHAYAASFGDDFARKSISENMGRGGNLLDPWVGSATGPVQARMLGVNGIGIDVDPVACLIANVSVTPYHVDELNYISSVVDQKLKLVETELSSAKFPLDSWQAGANFSLNGFQGVVPANSAINFWFAPTQRAVLALLVEMSKSVPDPRHQALIQLAISSSIIRKWPNTISLARDIDHSRPHQVMRDDITVASQIQIFKKTIKVILARLGAINAASQNTATQWQIIEGNTKDKLEEIPLNSVDYILTSPPYFNAIDYPRSHKFSQWWLWPERYPLDKSAYLGLMSGNKDVEEISKCHAIVPDHWQAIEAIAGISLAIYKNLCKYIIELNDVVIQFYDLLKQNAKASFVVGNNSVKGRIIPTAEMLSVMLERSGLSNVSIEPRIIRPDRRRYPYGISGFKGLMTSEYVVHASKP